MSPTIKITNAGTLIDKVTIGDESVSVGNTAEVSDEYVARLEEEFPHVQFETGPEAEWSPAGTTSDPQGDGDDDQGDVT